MSASITAITIVALGTSLPDTFASLSAAQAEPFADSSIGNVTGSNSVNVFLGLGLPWLACCVFWRVAGEAQEAAWRMRYQSRPWYSPEMPVVFIVEGGELSYSVGVFIVCASVCLAVFQLRRAFLGGELGGPTVAKYATATIFVALWATYIVLSVLHAQ